MLHVEERGATLSFCSSLLLLSLQVGLHGRCLGSCRVYLISYDHGKLMFAVFMRCVRLAVVLS